MAVTVVAVTKSDLYTGPVQGYKVAGSFLSTVTSGDIVIGDGTNLDANFVGRAESDYESATKAIWFSTVCCPKLSVVAETAAAVDTAILPGAAIYYSSANRFDLGPGTYVGRAMTGIASGETATIGVQMDPKTAPAIADDTTYDLWCFGPFVGANIALNDLIVDGFKPGVAGTIQKVWYLPIVPSTTNCDIDLAFTIAGTQTTGGVITITDEAATEGDMIAGTAITAANSFTADQEINLKCVEASTALTEGSGNVYALVSYSHDHE